MVSRYMQKPVLGRTKVNREHLLLWDAFFSTALQMEKRISSDVLSRIHAGLLEADDTVGIQELVLQKQERVSEHNKKILQSLWQLYDTNGDRELDEDEIQPVILDSLTSLSKWMPMFFRELAQTNMKVIRHKYSAAQMSELRDLMTVFMEQSEDLVQQYLTDKLNDLPDVISKVWRHLDADHSGIIKQSEFLDNYSHAITAVLDPEELKTMLERLWLGDQNTSKDEHSYSESLASATNMLLNASPTAAGGGGNGLTSNDIFASKRRRRGLAALQPWKRQLLRVLPCVAPLVPGGTVALQEHAADERRKMLTRKKSRRARGNGNLYDIEISIDGDDDDDDGGGSGGGGSGSGGSGGGSLGNDSVASSRSDSTRTRRRRQMERQPTTSPTSHRRRHGSRDNSIKRQDSRVSPKSPKSPRSPRSPASRRAGRTPSLERHKSRRRSVERQSTQRHARRKSASPSSTSTSLRKQKTNRASSRERNSLARKPTHRRTASKKL